MPYRIEELTAAHIPAVLAFWTGMEGVGLNESDTPGRLTAFLDRNPGLSRIAFQDESLVGAVLCGHDGRRGTLHHLAVARTARGRGIGRALVDDCLRALGACGIQKCNIFLFADNAAGRKFWEQAGWKYRVDLHVLQHACPGV